MWILPAEKNRIAQRKGRRPQRLPPIHFSARFLRVDLPQWSAARRSCTAGIGADHTTLVRVETPLAAGALGYRLRRKRVGGNRSASTCPDERVAALCCRVFAEHRINQVRSRGAG